MSKMKKWVAAVLVAVMSSPTALPLGGRAWAELPAVASPVSVSPASVSPVDVRDEAVKAIRAGRFDDGAMLLARSGLNTADSQLVKLARWAEEYESSRQALLADRRKQYDKALEDIRKLVDAKADEFALEFAANRGYVLAEDKDAYARQDLIKSLIERSSRLAAAHEDEGQWVKALRLYSHLRQIEPMNIAWKDHLNACTRRVRILSLYAPDKLKAVREQDSKDLEALDKIIPPTTTRPAVRKTEEGEESAFKTDWRDNLRGIKPDMLWQSLIDVRSNYWRDVEFTKLMSGGLSAVRALLTTDGLETNFPGLADNAQKSAFLTRLSDLQTQLAAVSKGTEVFESSKLYRKLLEANKQTVNLPEEVVVYEFADGALAECDPFTNMIWPADLDEFNKSTQGEFSGVGIQISSDDDGSLKVVSPIEDSPAFKAGIKAGDIITHVNGKPCKGITTTQAVRVITGPSGTQVTLTIKSFDGSVKDYALTRETIKVGSLKGFRHKRGGGWDYMIDPDNRIAYLRLTNFTKTSGEELEKAAAELKEQGIRGLIFDLRYNPGGLLTAAIDVANKFLDRGVIVSTRPDRQTPQQPTSASARPDPDEIKVPVVVLVNQYSASASEIVSGALKDQGRAVVVGERSFGKGSVQMLFPVDQKTAYLKLTTSHYYLPSGRCLHKEDTSTTWGVDPDVKVELTPEQMAASQKARSQFDVLYRDNEQVLPTTTQPSADATTRPSENEIVIKSPEDLIAKDNQLGAALLLLRLQLNGIEVATGTPAPGVADRTTSR